jgi:hypothetical protein
MLEPKILAPWLVKHWLLPTQVTIGEGELRSKASTYFPFYDEMISAIPFGGSRPSIPECPEIIIKKHWTQFIMVQRIPRKH